MGSTTPVVMILTVAMMMAVIVVRVEGNYSVAIGGGRGLVDELIGNTRMANERFRKAGTEVACEVQRAAGRAVDKVEDVLGFGNGDHDYEEGSSSSNNRDGSNVSSPGNANYNITSDNDDDDEDDGENSEQQESGGIVSKGKEKVHETAKDISNKAQMAKETVTQKVGQAKDSIMVDAVSDGEKKNGKCKESGERKAKRKPEEGYCPAKKRAKEDVDSAQSQIHFHDQEDL